jgi:DNA-binding NarL/FixJ family response regulator
MPGGRTAERKSMSGRNGGGVLVVDEDSAFRQFVVETLTQAGYGVREASSGRAGFAMARRSEPTLILLDLHLPDISGYEACRQLRESHGEGLPIVLMSGVKTDDLDRIAGLLLGADDYLVKPIEAGELLARIRRVALRSGASLVPNDSNPVRDKLTAREQQVLQMLGDGLSQNEIATKLVISPKTVGTHLQHILSKLEVHSRAQAVTIAHRFGDYQPIT